MLMVSVMLGFANIVGAILVFDVSNRASLSSISKWKSDVYKKLPFSIPILLLGNKVS